MTEENPSYFATIPANVRYDKRLKLLSRFMWGEISALSNQKGYCWATNKYFADLYDVSIQTVSGCIKQLKDYGYIDVKIIYAENSKQIKKRVISLIGIKENFKGGIKENLNTPIKENFKDNNTSMNNTSMNINSDLLNSKQTNPIKKVDPYMVNEIEIYFANEYKKRFNNKPYILRNQKEKLQELEYSIDNFKETIPEMLDNLKNIEFRFENKPTVHPDYIWLLKDDNYIKLLSGYYNENIEQTKERKRIYEEMEARQ